MERRRIDVHHHIAPPAYLAEIGADISPPLKTWSLAKAIEDMDAGNVATALVSITQIAMRLTDRARIRRLARACNDYAAKMVADHRGRFGMFVALPLPDVAGSLAEIEYGLDQLKADGVGLYTSYHDKWLGDPLFDPLFEELNRRKVVCYVHPAVPDCCLNFVPGVMDAAIEYGTDTTRAIARMVFSGASQRFPDMRMIWSHAGGTMPYLVERFTRMTQMPEYRGKFPGGFLAEAQKFFYDTAQVSNRYTLATARLVVPASQFVFGTDYPYLTAAEHVEGLYGCGVFTAAELRAIDRDNLAGLLRQYAD
jgi:predicted TIM-barrel fold metal-dependent hydrolase